MIDIHSHLLPGLDDGARDWSVTESMIDLAASSGTSIIVASPHADPYYTYHPATVDALVAEANQRAAGRLTILPGCDFHLTHDNLTDALAHPNRYTIAHLNYLLVEFSDLIIFPNTSELFARLEDTGIRIIVTHPERNPLLRQRPELLEAWVAAGRFIQLTAQSLTGGWGASAQKFCRLLLDKGLAHFIASDAHDPRHRPPTLEPARQWLAEHYSPELAEHLTQTNPAAVIEGRPLPPLPALPPPRRFSLNPFRRG